MCVIIIILQNEQLRVENEALQRQNREWKGEVEMLKLQVCVRVFCSMTSIYIVGTSHFCPL